MSSTTFTARSLSGTTELAQAAARLLAADDGDVTCYWNYASLDDPLIEVLNGSGAHLWDRTGHIRIVYPTVALSEPALTDHIARQQDHGAEVGHSRRLPPGAMLLTAHGALVTSRPHAGCRYEEVEDANTLYALRGLMKLVVQYTEPLPAHGEAAPNETERQLLDMLMEGLTDRAVARRLGLSERTVRRLVAQLMDRLGAASRFEAGARAVERGWIE